MSFSKELLLDDLRFSSWSNQRLLNASSTLPAAELERNLGISHSSILVTLNHICDAEKVWLGCLRSAGPDEVWPQPKEPSAQLPLPELQQTWAGIRQGLQQWVEARSENDLRVVLPLRLPPGIKHLARWQVLRHALDHSIFHRGQIIGMIRTLGHLPPAINRMDYFLMESAATK